MNSPGRSAQRGGFFLGLIVGMLTGLAIALGVALYVTKVPVPFVNKVPQRSSEQDAAQAEKNRSWDPNAPLSGKSAARPAAGASAAAQALPSATPVPGSNAGATRAAKSAEAPTAATKMDAKEGTLDPFTYFVQAGAYARAEDAEQQRARLALMGQLAKVTERDQAGRTVYRVRLGPFERKEEADAAKDKLEGAGVEAALVRVQR